MLDSLSVMFLADKPFCWWWTLTFEMDTILATHQHVFTHSADSEKGGGLLSLLNLLGQPVT